MKKYAKFHRKLHTILVKFTIWCVIRFRLATRNIKPLNHIAFNQKKPYDDLYAILHNMFHLINTRERRDLYIGMGKVSRNTVSVLKSFVVSPVSLT